MPTDEEIFSQLARAVLEATERLNAGEGAEEDLPTSADLARRFNYRLEKVKKKLRVLKEAGLIRPVGMTPKRYRFDTWALKSLDESHEFYLLLCEPESPYRLQS